MNVPELPYVDDPVEAAFQALYGPWAAWTPAQAAQELKGWDRPWWVVGGWAIDAFTGIQRQHEDIDVAIFRAHVPDLRAHLDGRFHCWAVGDTALRPLEEHRAELPDYADQVWIRRHAWEPWVADVVTSPDEDGAWVFPRDSSMVRPLEQVTWVADDGVRYLRPELVLGFKAKLNRPPGDPDAGGTRAKDDADLERTWPLLEEDARAWLRSFVEQHHVGHPWLARMR